MRHSHLFVSLALLLAIAFVVEAREAVSVLSILPGPSSSVSTYPVSLSGRDPVTIVFDSAVIALGSDFGEEIPEALVPLSLSVNVPGRIRWVTTSIARFDPAIDWPNDLDFTVTVNPLLKTFDGKSVEVASQQYVTAASSMYITEVKSEIASSHGTFWRSNLGHILPDGTHINEHEVPADGEIYIQFSTDIVLSSVGEALRLSPSGEYTYKACPNNQRCIRVLPSGLDVDTKYTLTLPAGSKVGEFSGHTVSDISVQFYGLFDFRFPFLQYDVQPTGYMKLYLRHGLDASVSAADIEAALQVTPAVDFSVVIYDFYVELRGDFVPEQLISLNVFDSANVVDKYGQTLKSGSTELTTDDYRSIGVAAQGGKVIQFETFDQPWVIFSRVVKEGRGCQPTDYEFLNVDKSNILSVLQNYISRGGSISGSEKHSVSTVVNEFDILSVDTASLFGDTGAFLINTHSCNNWNQRFVTKNNLATTVVASRGDSASSVVWVNRLDSNEAGANLPISVYTFSWQDPVARLSFSGTTDSDGIFQFDHLVQHKEAIVVVEDGASLHISPFLQLSPPIERTLEDYRVEVILDRAFHKPGDKVYVKGYVQNVKLDRDDLSPVAQSAATVTLAWKRNEEPTSYEVKTNQFGAFHLTLDVPADATLGDTSLYISGDSFSGSTTITLADPRIPTASLSIETEASIVQIGEPLAFDIAVATYTGGVIPNAVVKGKWTVKRARPYFYTPGFYYGFQAINELQSATRAEDESGEFELTVDQNGQATYSLDFDDLLVSPLEVGNAVDISLEYFSLSKELLTETLSLPVAKSELSLSLKSTAEGRILPGYSFGVFASIQDVTKDGAPADSALVTLQLFEWDGMTAPTEKSNGELEFDSAPVQECSFTSVNGGTNPGCELALPALGRYLLSGSIRDGSRYVSSLLAVGATEAEWQESPLSSLNGISFVQDKSEYSLGDTVTLTYYNPFLESRTLVSYGNDSPKYLVESSSKSGKTKLSFTIGDECFGGCNVAIAISAPRGSLAPLPVFVPTSSLFDYDIPGTVTSIIPISVLVPKRELDVSVSTFQEIGTPGGRAGLVIDLSKDNQPTAGEVTVFVVNKAVLDLKPHPISSYANQLASRYVRTYYSIIDSRSELALEEGYTASKESFNRRLLENPWAYATWLLRPTAYARADVDLTDEEFYSRFSSQITEFSYYYAQYYSGGGPEFDGGFESAPNAPPGASGIPGEASVPDRSGLGNDGFSSSAPVAVRTDFVVTPYFLGSQSVPASGRVELEYDLPDDIGTFEVRVYAIDTESNFGFGTVDQVSRRTLSMQSAAPRIVRTGDEFFSGVTVTVHDPEFIGEVTVTVSHVCQLLKLYSSQSQIIGFKKGDGPKLINFHFLSVGTGDAYLSFTAELNGIPADAALYPQPVLGQQEPVYIATSFAISEDSPSTQGFVLPDALPYSGTLNIDAAVGRLPAVNALSALTFDSAQASRPSSLALLSSLIPKLAYESYSVTGETSDLASEIFSQSLKKLASYSRSGCGLQYSDYQHSRCYTSLRLQAYGLWTLNQVSDLLSDSERTLVDTFTAQWTNALEQELNRQASIARGFDLKFSDFNSLAFIYHALGHDWTPSQQYTYVGDYSVDLLIENVDKLNVDAKAALVQLLHRDNAEPVLRSHFLAEITNSFRVQGRTAYITNGGQNPANLACGLTLTSYILDDSSSPLVEKLANFNGQEQPEGLTYRPSYGPEQLSHFITSLAQYDSWKGNNKPDLQVDVSSGGNSLLSHKFTSPSAVSHETSFFEDIDDPSSIIFSALGSGEASVLFGTEFVPLEINTELIDRGVRVTKVIQRINPATGEPEGPSITEASIGETVAVTIQFTIPDYSPSLIIVDPTTAALEPLDENIYGSTGGIDPCPYCSRYGGSYDWGWYFGGALNEKEFYSDRVIFYGTNLFGGTHTVTYNSLVNTEGVFVLPPTKVYDSFQPELMGLSAGGTFTTLKDIGNLRKEGLSQDCLKWENRVLDSDLIISPTQTTDVNPNYSSGSTSLAPTILAMGFALVSLVLL